MLDRLGRHLGVDLLQPPDYGADLAEPYGDGGSFSATIEVTAVIDGETDCREVRCGVVYPQRRHQPRRPVPGPVRAGGLRRRRRRPRRHQHRRQPQQRWRRRPWQAVGGVVAVAVAASAPFGVKRRERKQGGGVKRAWLLAALIGLARPAAAVVAGPGGGAGGGAGDDATDGADRPAGDALTDVPTEAPDAESCRSPSSRPTAAR